jgi:hypothetical protein
VRANALEEAGRPGLQLSSWRRSDVSPRTRAWRAARHYGGQVRIIVTSAGREVGDCTRNFATFCIETNDEWLVGRRYLPAESIFLALAGRDDHPTRRIKEEVPELQAA